MRRILCWFILLAGLFIPMQGVAANQSDDRMILDFTAEKVWVNKGDLCIRGTFCNKRGDLTVTKLDDMTVTILFTGKDGRQYEIERKPVRYPLLRLPANGRKKVTLNLGPFDGEWERWVVSSTCVFTYIGGSRW
ncbi:MAG: hypothetical protein SPI25_00840 [Dialister sp.]|nr:hypothetical protein [Dialister sp.]